MPFNLGFPELILIMVIALIVFGPRKLPEIGNAVGKAMREFRRATSEITEEFTRPMDEAITTTETPPMIADTTVADATPAIESIPSVQTLEVSSQTSEAASQSKSRGATKSRTPRKRSKPSASNHNQKEGANLGG